MLPEKVIISKVVKRLRRVGIFLENILVLASSTGSQNLKGFNKVKNKGAIKALFHASQSSRSPLLVVARDFSEPI